MSDLRERQPNNEVPCLHVSDLQKLYVSTVKHMKNSQVNFQISALTSHKRWKKKDAKAAPSSHGKICSGESWGFRNSTLLPAWSWSDLCVYLYMISRIPNLMDSHKNWEHFQILLTCIKFVMLLSWLKTLSPPPMCLCQCVWVCVYGR